MASIHETAEGLHSAGVMDKQNLLEFDEACLAPAPSDSSVVIPTLSKSKIPNSLSYPIGAERLSIALSSLPQIHDLKLHFFFDTDTSLRRGHYEFLREEYLHNAKSAESWPIHSLYKRPPQYRWEIVVQPVPRMFRKKITTYIETSALAQISLWLRDYASTKRRGSAMLTFFYDEKANEFTPRELINLEPLQAR